MTDLVWLIPLFPLLGFLINGLIGKRFSEQAIGWIGSLSVGASFVVALLIFLELIGTAPASRSFQKIVYTWMISGDLNVPIGFLVDPLSMVMLMVVSGVGCIIHIYSIGYMHGEFGFRRYFAYLNLFVFNMLILVSANNFLLMFVGWEGVGLCSYLLIGYYYEKKSASDAGKKAFVVNRVGDFGFLIGMFLIFVTFGTLNYTDVFAAAPEKLAAGGTLVTLITLLLFVGATGKSAQIPLYTWLPDAMEGPTPVSALIHAATMVTAGVYMVARCSVLFALAPDFHDCRGGHRRGNGLLRGHHRHHSVRHQTRPGLFDHQPARVHVHGLRCWGLWIGHLPSHDPRFFQGPPLHGSRQRYARHVRRTGHAQDGRPQVQAAIHVDWTYMFGTLAIAGIFPFAGFFSKDEILFYSLQRHLGFWILGAVAAIMTSFYMFRSVFMTFYGESRVDHETAHHLHESPPHYDCSSHGAGFSVACGRFGRNSHFGRLEPVRRFSGSCIRSGTGHPQHRLIMRSTPAWPWSWLLWGCRWPSPLLGFSSRAGCT